MCVCFYLYINIHSIHIYYVNKNFYFVTINHLTAVYLIHNYVRNLVLVLKILLVQESTTFLMFLSIKGKKTSFIYEM